MPTSYYNQTLRAVVAADCNLPHAETLTPSSLSLHAQLLLRAMRPMHGTRITSEGATDCISEMWTSLSMPQMQLLIVVVGLVFGVCITSRLIISAVEHEVLPDIVLQLQGCAARVRMMAKNTSASIENCDTVQQGSVAVGQDAGTVSTAEFARMRCELLHAMGRAHGLESEAARLRARVAELEAELKERPVSDADACGCLKCRSI